MTHSQPRQPSAADTPNIRQRIIARARQHFFSLGFRSVTMDDLAAELGMSKKTLYAAFPSKTNLLQAVMDHKYADIAASFDRITAAISDDLYANFQQLLMCIQENAGEIQPAFVRDLQRDAPELFKTTEERRRELIFTHFHRLLAHGRKQGTIRKDIPIPLMVEIVLAAVKSVVNPEKMVEFDVTPKVAFLSAIRLVLEGAIVREGSDS